MISWPVTLAILVLAFGSLVAAGLPLMLTILGLVAAAGSLYLGTQLLDISIWAMNFALMFALALGIDYALFIVYAVPRRVLRLAAVAGRDAAAVTMDTAGKAVLFSGADRADLAVGGDARAEPGVPLDEPRDHALGPLRPRRDAHPAARGAGEARARASTSSRSRGCTPGEHRSPRFARWGERLWRRPLVFGAARARRPGRAGAARSSQLEDRRCRRSRSCPSGDRSRQGYEPGPGRLRRRGARARSRSSPPQRDARRVAAIATADPGSRRSCPRSAAADGWRSCRPCPAQDPSSKAVGRDDRPAARGAAGRRARRRRGRREPRPRAALLSAKTPLVIGVVLGLGFLLLLVALQAPLIAARRRAHQPACHRRGVRRREVIFQDGHAAARCSASSRRAFSTPGARCSSSR